MAKLVSGESGLSRALSDAGGRLVVVDFYADWCGPCKMFAPEYEAMAAQMPDVLFLKVCEKDSADAMAARGIRAFPTFHLYLKNNKVEEMRGANGAGLRALIDKHKGSVQTSFSGHGLSLGGVSARPEDVREARLRALAGGSPAPRAAPAAAASSASVPVPVSAPVPAPAPAPAPAAPAVHRPAALSSSAPTARLSPTSMASLLEMGLGEVRAAKALMACGGKSVEAALQWLELHQDNMDIDEATEDVTAALAAASAPSGTGGDGGSGDVLMEDGGQAEATITAEELAEAQAAADAEAQGGGGSSSSAPPRRLTVEEAQARVKAIRAGKLATAKEDARLKEIARREGGKKSAEMQDTIRAQQRAVELDKMKREKERSERERVRQQIELWKDKAERESRTHGKVSDETAAKLKALQEGKPLPSATDPKEAVKKAIVGMALQKKDGVGRVAAETLTKLLSNAAAKPEEDKFRELKYSMQMFKERLMVAPPSLSLLAAVGFVKGEGGDGPVLRMTREHAESEEGQSILKHALAELQAALDAKAFD